MAGIPKVTISFDADLDKLKKGTADAQKEIQSFGDKVADFGTKAVKAFALAAVAAGAYAIKLGIDGVKAAIEDEQAQVKLATALKNVTGATDTQIAANEEFLKSLSLQTAFADDELRPSLQRLVNSTKDVAEAQGLLDLSTRISVNEGKSLEQVSNALAKAHDGNTTALGKLGIAISAAELKGLSYSEMIAKLNALYPDLGANAETVAFKFKLFQNAVNEAKETVGAALLPVMTKLMDFMNGQAIPAINAFVAGLTGDKGAAKGLEKTAKSAYELGVTVGEATGSIADMFKTFDGKGQSSLNGFINVLKVFAGVLNVVVNIIKELAALTIEFFNIVIKGLNLFGAKIQEIPQISSSALAKFQAQVYSANPNLKGGSASTGTGTGTGMGTGLGTGTGTGTGTGSSSGGAGGFSTSAATSATDLVDKLTDVSSKIGDLTFLYQTGAITKAAASSQLNALQKQFDLLTKQADALAAMQPSGISGQVSSDSAASITINFNGVVGDPEATAAVIVDNLNTSIARGGVATSLANKIAAMA